MLSSTGHVDLWINHPPSWICKPCKTSSGLGALKTTKSTKSTVYTDCRRIEGRRARIHLTRFTGPEVRARIQATLFETPWHTIYENLVLNPVGFLSTSRMFGEGLEVFQHNHNVQSFTTYVTYPSCRSLGAAEARQKLWKILGAKSRFWSGGSQTSCFDDESREIWITELWIHMLWCFFKQIIYFITKIWVTSHSSSGCFWTQSTPDVPEFFSNWPLGWSSTLAARVPPVSALTNNKNSDPYVPHGESSWKRSPLIGANSYLAWTAIMMQKRIQQNGHQPKKQLKPNCIQYVLKCLL